jgi:hypothetical protein
LDSGKFDEKERFNALRLAVIQDIIQKAKILLLRSVIWTSSIVLMFFNYR